MTELIAPFRLGSMHVAALSDGVGQQQPSDWFPDVPDEEWMAAVGATDPTATLPVNFGSFLVRRGDTTALIDTGNGERTRGQHEGAAGLLDRMADLGVTPDDIDVVLLTHFHGDHVGWNVLEDGGPITFPNARYYLHYMDLAYLNNEANTGAGTDFSRSRVLPIREAGQLATFDGEYEPIEGVTFVPTPGHTPGHCSIVLSSHGERLYIVGDAAPNTVHLEHPGWTPVFDLDPAGASHSRRGLSERAAREGALVTGGHFPILTIGRLEQVEGRTRWVDADVERIAPGDFPRDEPDSLASNG